MQLDLQNKVVLVTGGSKGIGEGIVRSFLAEGARVVNVNRSGPEGEALSAEYKARGQVCEFIPADLTDVAGCESIIRRVLDQFGRLDVLVNNAGVNDGVGLDAGPTAFLSSLQRNLLHVYGLAHYARTALCEARGTIINIGSKVSVTGQGGTSGYAASKGAINALTREWAADLAPHGVRVNAVLPAEVWTPLYEKWLNTLPNPSETRQQIEHLVPLGHRFTTKEELADMVVFLASPRSGHTTGQIIFVDGGYTHLDRKLTASS